jgi:hypothetical protein
MFSEFVATFGLLAVIRERAVSSWTRQAT